MPDNNIIPSQTPSGTWCHYQKEKQHYSLGSRVFEKRDTFVLIFTLFWTTGFLVFLYQTLFLVLISEASFEWFSVFFWFSHGLPTYFLCRYSIKAVFGKIILTVDPQKVCFFKGVFNRGTTEEFLLHDIKHIRITEKEGESDKKTVRVQSITLYAGETTLEFGKMLSKKKLDFLHQNLQQLLTKAQQGNLLIEDDFSRHLID
ncbi:MAG: hypothetical protein ACRBFS_03870 [Aureispira sp.]